MSFRVIPYTTPGAIDRSPAESKSGNGSLSGTPGSIHFDITPTKLNMSSSPTLVDLAGMYEGVASITQDVSGQSYNMQGGRATFAVFNFSPGTPNPEITIVGTSIDGVTNVPVVGDTEVISIPGAVQSTTYQSSKRWLEITDVTISTAGITDTVLSRHGPAQLPKDIKITGYEFEAVPTDNIAAEIILRIYKTTPDTSIARYTLEDIVISSGGSFPRGVTDNLRPGVDSRTYGSVGPPFYQANQKFVYQQLDFNDYMGPTSTKTIIVSDFLSSSNAPAANENILEFSEGEGLWIQLDSGGGVDLVNALTYANLTLHYEYL